MTAPVGPIAVAFTLAGILDTLGFATRSGERSRTQTRLAVAIRLCLSAAVAPAAPAQSSSTPAPRELTALDYIQIQQLVARDARAIDTCANNGYDYVDHRRDRGPRLTWGVRGVALRA